jgi:very-short-patch-repair endonuclease
LNGLKFRRQHPIHFYVADFYCHEKRLIIEIDGGIHEEDRIKEHDDNRTAELERLGIRVIRFTNDEVIKSKELVLKRIIDFLQ